MKHRGLGVIAADLRRLDRERVIEAGKLLNEAKAACDRGRWCSWLREEFGWADGAADRKIRVAELADNFRELSNLNLPTMTLYDLTEERYTYYLEILICAILKRAPVSAAEARELIESVVSTGRFEEATVPNINNHAATRRCANIVRFPKKRSLPL